MKTCKIDGCDAALLARGWCRKHYDRWWNRGGDPSVAKKRADGTALLFYNSTVVSYDGNDCLIWPFSRSRGHAYVNFDKSQRIVARLLCEEVHGTPPTPKHEARHLCGKGHLGCVTKRHLVWGTHKENQADRILHGTTNRGERCGSAKLTEADVLHIRSLSGLSASAIAKEFNVTVGAIRMILKRKTWAWLI